MPARQPRAPRPGPLPQGTGEGIGSGTSPSVGKAGRTGDELWVESFEIHDPLSHAHSGKVGERESLQHLAFSWAGSLEIPRPPSSA